MGSVLDITLPGIDGGRGEELLRASFAEVWRIERLLSVFDPGSELSRVNREASLGPTAVDAELLSLIDQARRFWAMSGGAVDVTVSPLIGSWRACDDRHGGVPLRPPAGDELDGLLERVGFSHVDVDLRAGTVAYRDSRVGIEFGALGKGYAVDRVVRLLVAAGVSTALVDFGSAAYALGRPPGEDAWRVGIRHPRDARRVLGVVRLTDRAIASSGDDQQAIVIRGVRYGHILDPRTGRPARRAVSTSAVAETALEADALSTAAFVCGPREGVDLLEALGLEGVIATQDSKGRVVSAETSGWRGLTVEPCPPRSVSRRRILIGMVAAAMAVIARPPLGWAVVYVSREEALKALIPEAAQFTPQTISFTDAQRQRIESLTGTRFRDAEATFWIAHTDGHPLGYATVLDVVGKEQPITFMIAVAPEGSVRGVQVLIYRESQGSEIRSKRFLSQFVGKTLDAPLRLGRDVHSISGATLSSRSTTVAVKKALALVTVVYGSGAAHP